MKMQKEWRSRPIYEETKSFKMHEQIVKGKQMLSRISSKLSKNLIVVLRCNKKRMKMGSNKNKQKKNSLNLYAKAC